MISSHGVHARGSVIISLICRREESYSMHTLASGIGKVVHLPRVQPALQEGPNLNSCTVHCTVTETVQVSLAGGNFPGMVIPTGKGLGQGYGAPLTTTQFAICC